MNNLKVEEITNPTTLTSLHVLTQWELTRKGSWLNLNSETKPDNYKQVEEYYDKLKQLQVELDAQVTVVLKNYV